MTRKILPELMARRDLKWTLGGALALVLAAFVGASLLNVESPATQSPELTRLEAAVAAMENSSLKAEAAKKDSAAKSVEPKSSATAAALFGLDENAETEASDNLNPEDSTEAASSEASPTPLARSKRKKPAAAPRASFGAAGRMMTGLLVVIGLGLLGLFFGRKLMKKMRVAPQGDRVLRVIDAIPLGPKRQVYVLEIHGRQLVVGATADQLRTLGEFESDEIAQARGEEAIAEESARTEVSKISDRMPEAFAAELAVAGSVTESVTRTVAHDKVSNPEPISSASSTDESRNSSESSEPTSRSKRAPQKALPAAGSTDRTEPKVRGRKAKKKAASKDQKARPLKSADETTVDLSQLPPEFADLIRRKSSGTSSIEIEV